MRAHIVLACLALAAPALAKTAEDPPCPLHAQRQQEAQAVSQGHDHHAAIDARGDRVMGFDHLRTTHNFLLEPDGGVIQVQAKDPADQESVARIRHHLAEIAGKLAAGDFSMPFAIHDRVLPGIPEMIRLKGDIRFRYEELERGARVRIATGNPEARAAVHAFLRAQIEDHRTGDPLSP